MRWRQLRVWQGGEEGSMQEEEGRTTAHTSPSVLLILCFLTCNKLVAKHAPKKAADLQGDLQRSQRGCAVSRRELTGGLGADCSVHASVRVKSVTQRVCSSSEVYLKPPCASKSKQMRVSASCETHLCLPIYRIILLFKWTL